MSVGFIMYEIVDMDSHKYQGINTVKNTVAKFSVVGYSLKNQGINTSDRERAFDILLDIHLNIKVLTPLSVDTASLD
ncbi:MAG: hypothetical protein J6J14_00520 [Rikenellaceae bacterium]|nr:hypothetical protein [Rikenellaceae bacterium]